MDRRTFLGMGLTGAAGVAAGASSTLGIMAANSALHSNSTGLVTVPFYGTHQSGVDTPQASHAALVAFTLRPGTDRQAIARLLRVWSGDAALLQAGQPAMGDANPESAATPSALTVTVGLGFGAFAAAGLADRWPFDLHDVPAFPIDRLEPRWSGGDLLLQISANDASPVAHALRELVRDADPVATVRWQQSGWQVGAGVNATGEYARNIMGFREGAGNPQPSTQRFSQTVWNTGQRQDWFAGGTSMVVRRIRVDLRRWDQAPPAMQNAVFGRYKQNGAPLGGFSEFEAPDFQARTAHGALVIPGDAHMRRAHGAQRIYRRAFNYDDGYTVNGEPDAGLVFIAFGADPQQYVEIQRSLAASDALNMWTTPVGAGLFAVPPGLTGSTDWFARACFE